ncbi:MAG: AAA family ATPase [Myxococcales bacterium]|nr:AAA family ATPase [Myxococcales bacterium]
MAAAKRPRLVLIDDGLTYVAALRDQCPEFDLVDPGAPHGEQGRLPDGPAALAWLDTHARNVDAVLLDVQFDVADNRLLPLAGPAASPRKLRRYQGVAILAELRRRHPGLPVVLLTALEDLALADAAADASAEPLVHFSGTGDLDALRIQVHAALADTPVEEDGVLWGRDVAVRALRRRLSVLARGPMPVVLEGPTGTGKSHLAERFVHRNAGRRGPFVALDLATVPADLVAGALFGVVRGAFTGAVADRVGAFQAAHGGTLFLDEIQNTSAAVQQQLLRVLQERRVRPVGGIRETDVDVKVVVATNVPLEEAVRAGTFRPDLAMRLGPAWRARLPALSERPHDLAFLLRKMVDVAARRPEADDLARAARRALALPADAPVRLVLGNDLRTPGDPAALELTLPAAAWATLRRHSWPGNLRELDAVAANIVYFTLFGAVDAVRSGVTLASTRLQIDAGLVHGLLGSAQAGGASRAAAAAPGSVAVAAHSEGAAGLPVAFHVAPRATLALVALEAERHVLLAAWHATAGDWPKMAERLLGDSRRARAVQLRFNQVGLRVRDLARGG